MYRCFLISPTIEQPQWPHATKPEKAKLCLARRCFLAWRPSSTSCTRSQSSGIEAITQDRVHRTHRYRRMALPVDEPRGPNLLRSLSQRERTGRVPFEETTDQRGGVWIRLDDLLS